MHAQVLGEQFFTRLGVGCVAQQQAFKAFGVGFADVDLFNQAAASCDVIGRQPLGKVKTQMVAHAQRAFGATDQVFQGQVGQAHAHGLHDTQGAISPGDRQKGQLNFVGV